MFDCHCDVFVFRDRILVSDYDAADEIQSACACVEDGHQAYVKVIFQPSALTDYATARHMRDWDCSTDISLSGGAPLFAVLALPHVRNFGGRPAFSQKVQLRFVPRNPKVIPTSCLVRQK